MFLLLQKNSYINTLKINKCMEDADLVIVLTSIFPISLLTPSSPIQSCSPFSLSSISSSWAIPLLLTLRLFPTNITSRWLNTTVKGRIILIEPTQTSSSTGAKWYPIVSEGTGILSICINPMEQFHSDWTRETLHANRTRQNISFLKVKGRIRKDLCVTCS